MGLFPKSQKIKLILDAKKIVFYPILFDHYISQIPFCL